MFARSNIVQTSIAHARVTEKTDEELLQELKDEEAETLSDEVIPIGRDPSKYTEGTWQWHIANFSKYPTMIVEGKYESYFNGIVISAIVLAGVLVGMQTYDSLDEDENWYFAIEVLNYCVLGIFALEFLLKVASEGMHPFRYFYGPDGFWNCFDFLVLIFSLPTGGDSLEEKEAEDNSKVFRILSRVARLIRLAKIIKRIPQLHVIIKGLVGGMTGISFIGILLGLVFYVYAVAGVLLFRDNDPFHFGTIGVAFMSLFRAATLENWADIMYINFYGCASYTGGIYVMPDDFPAMTRNGCVQSIEKYPAMYTCYESQKDANDDAAYNLPQPVISSLYWGSFIVTSSLVMLSLFIGVVTMSMQDSMAEMRSELNMAARKSKLNKSREHFEAMAGEEKGISPQPSSEKGVDVGEKQAGVAGFIKRTGARASMVASAVTDVTKNVIRRQSTHKQAEAARDFRLMKYLMMQAWHGTAATDEHETEFDHNPDIDSYDFLLKILRKTSVRARDLINTVYFTHLVTAVITLTAVVVGIQANNRKEDQGLATIEIFITAFYGIEILVRMAACEFHLTEYLHDRWNVFDFSVWVGSMTVQLSTDNSSGALIVVLRTLRLLRVLKLVKSLPQLALIVNALIMGLSSIGFIGVILFLAFYMFAILGIILFKDNDKINFGSLEVAYLSLFKCATLDNWGNVMYVNMFGCDIYPPPYCRELDSDMTCDGDGVDGDEDGEFSVDNFDVICDDPFVLKRCHTDEAVARPATAVAFFVTFIVVAALVLLTLFVGVVTTSMEEASKQQDISLQMEAKIREICSGHEVTAEQMDIYRRVFNMLDMDGGGTIDPLELKVGLRCVHIRPTAQELNDYVVEIDQNNDGTIDLVEFVVFMTNMKEKNLAEKRRRDEEERAARKAAGGGGAYSMRFGMSFRGSGSNAGSSANRGAYPTSPSSFSRAMSGLFSRKSDADKVTHLDEPDIDLDAPVRPARGSIYGPPPALRAKPGDRYIPPGEIREEREEGRKDEIREEDRRNPTPDLLPTKILKPSEMFAIDNMREEDSLSEDSL